MAPNWQLSFWERNGLADSVRDDFMSSVRQHHPGYCITEVLEQGYCSFSVLAVPELGKEYDHSSHPVYRGKSYIYQLRPEKHALNLGIASAAKSTYAELAPTVVLEGRDVLDGFMVFSMEMLPGTSYSRLRPKKSLLDPEDWKKQTTLIRSFATFIAKAWPAASQLPSGVSRSVRADSPISGAAPGFVGLQRCEGNVGARIEEKLKRLATDLPSPALRLRAQETLSRLPELVDFPIVLNHGDLIPSNILVDPTTWEITGLVDWAEAEFLPFGTCLYGLELLLGFLDTPPLTLEQCAAKPTFVYYNAAEALRSIFWQHIWELRPEMKATMKEIALARDIGVLLWYGYAWDEGSIDRVVDYRNDATELECLRKFLGVA